MKPCPVCGEDPKPEVDGFTWRWTCRACVISATPAAWAALPRVAPNAEALVDALVSAACARRYCEDGDTQDVMRARAELLRACVVAPPITAEALWKFALDGGSPLLKNHMSYAMCEELAAALAALGGGK